MEGVAFAGIDGEPHVFGNRIYLYGSHDRFRGAGFCLNDYVCYSVDVKDLTEWRYEGVIYRKEQDPRNQNIPADAPEQKLLFGILPEGPEDLNPKGIHAMRLVTDQMVDIVMVVHWWISEMFF